MGMEGLQDVAAVALREIGRRKRLWLLTLLILMAVCLFMIFCQPARAATNRVPLQPILDQLVQRGENDRA